MKNKKRTKTEKALGWRARVRRKQFQGGGGDKRKEKCRCTAALLREAQ